MNIELFSCAGGMAEGFRRAGITFDWVFDKDPDAIASYTHNLGHAPVQMDVRDLLRMVRGGWSPGPVRLLVADPPCVPWSRAGKRLGSEDERDMIHETADLIAALRPQAYLIGNVPGLNDSTNWHVVQDVIGGLAQYGYCVADYASLDAADYGVPQHRVRPFWFGHLDGPCIRWPAPTHCDPAQLATLTLPGIGPTLARWVTCRDALAHLPLEKLGRPVRLRWGAKQHGQALAVPEGATSAPLFGRVRRQNGKETYSDPYKPARVVGTSTLSDGNVMRGDDTGWPWDRPAVLTTNRKHPINDPSRPSHTVTAKSECGAQGAHALSWPWGRPATTIHCEERIGPPGHHDGTSWNSAPNAIILSELAAAILQGFPEDWVFSGATKKARWSQIGQAMPPPLAEAVARSIVAQLAATTGAGANRCA